MATDNGKSDNNENLSNSKPGSKPPKALKADKKKRKKKKSTFELVKIYGLWGFLVIFLISIFLGLGAFSWIYFLNPTSGQATSGQGPAESARPNVVLTVDGDKIDRRDFLYAYRNLAQRYGASDFGAQTIALENLAVESLIQKQIFLQYAEANKIKVDSAEVKSRLTDQRNMYLGENAKLEDTSLMGRVKWQLAERRRDREFRNIIFRMGFGYSEFEDNFRKDMLSDKAREKLAESLRSTEDAAAKKKAEEVLAKVKAGKETFEDLAAEYSQDTTTAERGGDRGWLKRGELPPEQAEYEKIAFSLEPGVVADHPVKTKAGHHILKVVAKKTAADPGFQDEKEEIRKRLEEERGKDGQPVTEEDVKKEYEKVLTSHILFSVKSDNEVVSKWFEEERPKRKVEILDPVVKAFRFANQLDLPAESRKDAKLDYPMAEKLYQKAIDAATDDPYVYDRLSRLYVEQYQEAVKKEKDKRAEEKKKKEEKKKASESATGTVDLASEPDLEKAEEAEPAVDPFNPEGEAKPVADGAGESDEEVRLPDNVHLAKALDQALLAKEKAEIRGADSSIYYNLANVYYEKGDKKKSLAELNDAAEMAGAEVFTVMQIKALYEKLGETKKAAEMQRLIDDIRNAPPTQ